MSHFAGCSVFFNKDTLYPTSMSSPSTFMTPGESFTIILSKANMAGFQKVLCHVLRFGVLQPGAKQSSHYFIIAHQQCPRQEKRYCQEHHPGRSFSYDLSRHWFDCKWLQWCSLALLQPWQSQFYLWSFWLIVLCLRRRLPTPVGSWIHSEHLGVLSASGRWISMVLSLHFEKLSVYAPMIKAAIMRRGFICTSLTGVTSGTTRLATTGISASQNVRTNSGNRVPKRHFCEVLSDHSLSS